MIRKIFVQKLASLTGLFLFNPIHLFAEDEKNKLRRLVQEIGNTNDEKERAELLKKLIANHNFSSREEEIIKRLFFVIDRWANGYEKYANPGVEGNEGSGYLCGFFSRYSIERTFFPVLDESDPLFPLVAFSWSRILIALFIQNGHVQFIPENRDKYLAEIKRLLQYAKKSFPKNDIIKAYCGEFETWEDLVRPDNNAPVWANSQRMVLEKFTYLTHWWIDNRQISDGQFGGGWGDDVEIWRRWGPVLFAFEDKKVIRSQRKLFEGLYQLPKMAKGYTTELNDVEHTSEEYADPLTCMIALEPENKDWEQRALKVLDYMENLWSGINEKKQLQFKSTWFSVDRIDLDNKRACDTPYHSRLIQPLMLIWLKTGNERIGKFITTWLRTWVDATFSGACGKPEGIVPAAIHWPDGNPCGTGKNWWQPENYKTPLYDFPSQQDTMYEYFLQAFSQTKDEYFLKPIRFIGERLIEGKGDMPLGDCEAGSLEWCLNKLKKRLSNLFIIYRRVTGDSSYDKLRKQYGINDTDTQLDYNLEELTKQFDSQRESLSLPEEFYTTEVRWTDRLFSFGVFFRHILGNPLPGFNANFLSSTIAGSIEDYKISPTLGIKWLTHSTEIAIVTEVNKSEKFQARLFHFGNKQRKMGVRFFNLKNGSYNILINEKEYKAFEITDKIRDVKFSIPPQKLCIIRVEKI
ncbi:MAG: hypothetical protein R2764_24270 [Bacteroidales bacterium]